MATHAEPKDTRRLRRGEHIKVLPFEGFILNAIVEDKKVVGYRIAVKGFWAIVPAEMIQKMGSEDCQG